MRCHKAEHEVMFGGLKTVLKGTLVPSRLERHLAPRLATLADNVKIVTVIVDIKYQRCNIIPGEVETLKKIKVVDILPPS